MTFIYPEYPTQNQKRNIISKLSPLAIIKLFLLTYGLDIDLASLYNTYGRNMIGYKTKITQSVPKVVNRSIIERKANGCFSIPSEIKILMDGKESIVKVVFNLTSPYLLFSDSGKSFILDKKSNRIIDLEVELCRKKECLSSEICGSQLNNYLSFIGEDRISIILYMGCQHWLSGDQCKFCNLFALPRLKNKIIPNVNDINSKFFGDINKWWESKKGRYFTCLKKSLKRTLSTVNHAPHTHLCIMAGNLEDISFQWKITIELASIVNEVYPLSCCDSYLNIMPIKNKKTIGIMREMGFKNIQLNLEVFGENYYKKICPGKAKIIRYEDFISSLKYVAEIFGKGNIRTNIVLGIQPLDSVKKGAIELANYGIVTDYTIFIPKQGTAFGTRHPPPIDQVADFTIFLTNLYHKFNFKPIYCSLSSRSSIMNEHFYS